MAKARNKTGFGKPKPIVRRSYSIEFKRRYPDGSELDLWWWRVNVPKLDSSAAEERIAQLVCDRALAAFHHLPNIRKPNLIYILTADKRWTLGEGFLGELEGATPIKNDRVLAAVVKELSHAR